MPILQEHYAFLELPIELDITYLHDDGKVIIESVVVGKRDIVDALVDGGYEQELLDCCWEDLHQ
jgi:hypothetical protein